MMPPRSLTTITINADDLADALIDPGEYVARVGHVEIVRDGLVHTKFRILSEDGESVLTNITVKFNPRKPMKIKQFLEASGQPLVPGKPFSPAKWKNKVCLVGIDVITFPDEETGDEITKNYITGFLLPPAEPEPAAENASDKQ